jgi:hypothetical protein
MPLLARSHGTISEPNVMPAVDCGSTLPCEPRLLRSWNWLPLARIDCIQ